MKGSTGVFLAQIGNPLQKYAWTGVAAVCVCSIVVGLQAIDLLSNWQDMPGWEALWVAKALAAGHGFSFPGNYRWLFPPDYSGAFYATAWVNPVYSGILGGLIWTFRSYYQLAAAILNLSLLAAVFALTYRVSERLMDSRTALVAVVVLALVPGFAACAGQIQDTMLATALILLTADTLISFAGKPDVGRTVAIGLVLGVTALACPNAQVFLPITVVLIWLLPIGVDRARMPVRAGTVLAVALMVMSPWAIRNYAAFGEFVPVRTGSGQISFIGTAAVGATVKPETLAADLLPPWRAASAGEAVYFTSQFKTMRQSLEWFQMAYAERVGGDAYAAKNEAQRDAWFRTKAAEYVLANPVLSIKLSAANLKRWVFADGAIGIWLCALTAIGAWVAIQQRSSVPIILGGWVAAYVAPFLFIVCYFNRYRAPIDPILVVVAIYGMRTVFLRYPPQADIGHRTT